MTKHEEYGLSFSKGKFNNQTNVYWTQNILSNDSYYLCSIINQVTDREHEDLLEEINLAVNGKDHIKSYSVDEALFNDSVNIFPPIAIIDGEHEVKLTDLKQILEEWVEFHRSAVRSCSTLLEYTL